MLRTFCRTRDKRERERQRESIECVAANWTDRKRSLGSARKDNDVLGRAERQRDATAEADS